MDLLFIKYILIDHCTKKVNEEKYLKFGLVVPLFSYLNECLLSTKYVLMLKVCRSMR